MGRRACPPLKGTPGSRDRFVHKDRSFGHLCSHRTPDLVNRQFTIRQGRPLAGLKMAHLLWGVDSLCHCFQCSQHRFIFRSQGVNLAIGRGNAAGQVGIGKYLRMEEVPEPAVTALV